jgi:hypothetical protein
MYNKNSRLLGALCKVDLKISMTNDDLKSSMLEEKVRKTLEIPIISLIFNRIGENVEQVSRHFEIFIKLFH